MQAEGTAPTSEWTQEVGLCFWKVSSCSQGIKGAEAQGPGRGGALLQFHPWRGCGWEVG